MRINICTATKEKEYQWYPEPESSARQQFVKWNFEDGQPWFGLVSQDGIMTLLVGNVNSSRRDRAGRQILNNAVVEVSDDETKHILGFVSELLKDPSCLSGKSVITDWLEKACLAGIAGEAIPEPPTSSYPVKDCKTEEIKVKAPLDSPLRVDIISQLHSLVSSGRPLLVGYTHRDAKALLRRIDKDFRQWNIAVFSSEVAKQEALAVDNQQQEGGSQAPSCDFFRWSRIKVAAGIGIVIVSVSASVCLSTCRNNPKESSRTSTSQTETAIPVITESPTQNLTTVSDTDKNIQLNTNSVENASMTNDTPSVSVEKSEISHQAKSEED